jgi:hypothetical protein
MARKFIFIKDIEQLLKQGKTEMDLPEGSRFSPAAWDLVRENNIQVSFREQSQALNADAGNTEIDSQSLSDQTSPELPQLAAIVSGAREITGKVGETVTGSPYFLIFDHDGKFIDIIKNPFIDKGTSADQMIVNLLTASQISAVAAEAFSGALRTQLSEKTFAILKFPVLLKKQSRLSLTQKGGDKSAGG